MVYIAMEPLQVVGSNHCLRAIWPLSHHRWSVVAGGSGWHLHKRIHSNSLSAVVVAPRATVLRDHLWSRVSFLGWFQTVAVTGQEEEDGCGQF